MINVDKEGGTEMTPYTQAIADYLSSHEPDYGDSNIHSLLEMLYRCYTEYNPIDNAVIRQQFSSLEPIMEKLPLTESDEVFYTFCRICIETERLAFLEGLRVGLRLEAEISA